MSSSFFPEHQERPEVSVIVPTLNESGNISPLVEALVESFGREGLSFEVLFADGGSTDGTVEEVAAAAAHGPARLIACRTGRGLAGDVTAASREARAEVVVVMDADLSHPAEAAPKLARLLLSGSWDVAVGSRFAPGGSTPGWPWTRRLISRLAALLARPLVAVSDPTSGFFAVRRERLRAVAPKARGFKILLEVLLEDGERLRITEVPISFHDRARGKSKMNLRQVTSYLRRLIVRDG